MCPLQPLALCKLGQLFALQVAGVFVIDILEGGAQFEAGLADEAVLFTLFPLQTFGFDQEGESVEEREVVIRAGLFGLLGQGLCHAGQVQVAQAGKGECGRGHGVSPLVEVLRPADILMVLGQRGG